MKSRLLILLINAYSFRHRGRIGGLHNYSTGWEALLILDSKLTTVIRSEAGASKSLRFFYARVKNHVTFQKPASL